jgi:hypothetical protein
MIATNTNIKLSEKQVDKLEAEADRRGMVNPTTPGILGAMIADLPEVENVRTVPTETESNEELFEKNADGSKHFKA